jgi:hypothetical protein
VRATSRSTSPAVVGATLGGLVMVPSRTPGWMTFALTALVTREVVVDAVAVEASRQLLLVNHLSLKSCIARRICRVLSLPIAPLTVDVT